jgi:hypothetical protein
MATKTQVLPKFLIGYTHSSPHVSMNKAPFSSACGTSPFR